MQSVCIEKPFTRLPSIASLITELAMLTGGPTCAGSMDGLAASVHLRAALLAPMLPLVLAADEREDSKTPAELLTTQLACSLLQLCACLWLQVRSLGLLLLRVIH